MQAMKEVDFSWFIFVGATLLTVFLLEIRFLNRQAKRILALFLGLASLAGVFLLQFTDTGASYPLRTALIQETPMTPQVWRGLEVYFKYGCPNCHQINGWGTPAGPDLAGVISQHGEDWVREYLITPRFRTTPSSMLHYSFLVEEELSNLISFLSSVKTPET